MTDTLTILLSAEPETPIRELATMYCMYDLELALSDQGKPAPWKVVLGWHEAGTADDVQRWCKADLFGSGAA